MSDSLNKGMFRNGGRGLCLSHASESASGSVSLLLLQKSRTTDFLNKRNSKERLADESKMISSRVNLLHGSLQWPWPSRSQPIHHQFSYTICGWTVAPLDGVDFNLVLNPIPYTRLSSCPRSALMVDKR